MGKLFFPEPKANRKRKSERKWNLLHWVCNGWRSSPSHNLHDLNWRRSLLFGSNLNQFLLLLFHSKSPIYIYFSEWTNMLMEWRNEIGTISPQGDRSLSLPSLSYLVFEFEHAFTLTVPFPLRIISFTFSFSTFITFCPLSPSPRIYSLELRGGERKRGKLVLIDAWYFDL